MLYYQQKTMDQQINSLEKCLNSKFGVQNLTYYYGKFLIIIDFNFAFKNLYAIVIRMDFL